MISTLTPTKAAALMCFLIGEKSTVIDTGEENDEKFSMVFNVMSDESCAYHGAGHIGDEFGKNGEAIHGTKALDKPNLTRECLERKCENMLDWCCFSRFMKVLVWYLDALQRYKLTYFFSHGSLIGVARAGGLPMCHTDAEIHVFIYNNTDEMKMQAIAREANMKTDFIWVKLPFQSFVPEIYIQITHDNSADSEPY